MGGMVLVGGGLLPSTTAQTLAATAVAAVRTTPVHHSLPHDPDQFQLHTSSEAAKLHHASTRDAL